MVRISVVIGSEHGDGTKDRFIGEHFGRLVIALCVPSTSRDKLTTRSQLIPEHYLDNMLVSFHLQIFNFCTNGVGDFFGPYLCVFFRVFSAYKY